jgi:HK97 family phage prohead protease
MPLLDWHGDSISRIIGSVKEMKSVPQGVWFRAGFTSDEQGQRARQLAKDGHLTGVSIGYQPIRQSMKMIGDRMVRVLHEIRIHEISLTPVPANPQAQLASVKSVEVATIGLDFDQFTIAARKAGELPDIAYKAAMAVLLDHYQPQAAELTEQAESTAEPTTAAATTPPGPAGTAPDAAHKGTSPSVPLTPREYVDSVLQRVEQADGSPASLDQLEARIRQSLGGAT